MNVLVSLFSEPWAQRLGWVLIHFIWQGTVIALLLALALRLLTRASSHVRYVIIGSALLLCGVIPAASWMAMGPKTAEPSIRLAPAVPPHVLSVSKVEASAALGESLWTGVALGSTGHAETRWQDRLNQTAGYLVCLWFAGVVILTTRLALGWALTRRLRLSGLPIGDSRCLERFQSLWKRMRVGAPVRLLQSALVEVPTLIGWLRPVILIPASVFMGLSPDHLEAILAHELAHVRRYDYLANLLQTVIETVLFYHPAVWWISGKLRQERENCCDDIAVEVLRDRLVYVTALAQIEERRGMPLALAASGGSLLQRIRRIAGTNDRKGTAWPLLLLIIGILAVVGVIEGKASAPAKSPPAEVVGSPSPSPGPSFRETKKAELKANMERLVTAARKGDAPQIRKIVEDCYKLPLRSDTEVKQLLCSLDALAGSRELQPFTCLLKELRQTGLARNWQPDDALLASLVKEGRKDFLDVLLRAGLDLKRFQEQQKVANAAMTAWISNRVAETERERKDVQALVEACGKGDIGTVRKLLDAGVNVNSRTSDNASFTPLTRAAVSGQTEVVRLLLQRGANVEQTKIEGSNYTPLCLASKPEIADLLLAAGAIINRNYGQGGGIISYCVTFGPKEMVQWFIDHGVDPKKVNGDGPMDPTLLFEAGTPEIAEMLIEHGVDVNAKGEGGRTAMIEIEQMVKNPAKVVEVLLKHGADPNQRMDGGYTPLMAAPDGATVDVLIAAGADINVKDERGKSLFAQYVPQADPSRLEALKRHGLHPDAQQTAEALQNAIVRKNLDEAKMLLKQGVDPSAHVQWEGQMGPSLLASALRWGEFKIADALREAGANDVGKLSESAAKGDSDQMRTLVAAGEDVNERDSVGETPLLFAVYCGQTSAIQFLLDHGANLNLFSTWGLSPYVDANNIKESLDAMNVSQIIRLKPDEARQVVNEILPLLRNHHPDLNYRNQDGETALSRVAAMGNIISIGCLLSEGADVNVQRNDGMTPLMLAIVSQPKDAPQLGTMRDPKTNKEKHFSERGDIVEMLLEKGADLTLKNKAGKTALDLAQENGNEEILSLLRKTNKADLPASTPAKSPTPQPIQGKADLQIDKASCGAGDSRRDITELLQKAVKNNSLSVTISQPFTEIGGDPAWGKPKDIVVDYHWNGKPGQLLLKEQYPVAFAIELPPTSPSKPAPGSQTKDEFQIDKAILGVGDAQRDVTEFLQKAVKNNALSITISQPFAEIGGDPAPGKQKGLLIDYHWNGKPRRIGFGESYPVAFAIHLPESSTSPDVDRGAQATGSSTPSPSPNASNPASITGESTLTLGNPLFKTLKERVNERFEQDRLTYTPEQFKELESLYQMANKQLDSPGAKGVLKMVIEKYPQSDRAGCALMYLAQRSKGPEQEDYLKEAIQNHGDCFYGDGVQVGAYARFYLADYYLQTGKTDEAKALQEQIRKDYPDAIDHSGNAQGAKQIADAVAAPIIPNGQGTSMAFMDPLLAYDEKAGAPDKASDAPGPSPSPEASSRDWRELRSAI